MQHKDELLSYLKDELVERASFFGNETMIDSVYFGGGTPSILKAEEMSVLIDTVKANYTCQTDTEWCLEANPDDLSESYLLELKLLGINRLSIGVQSLSDQWLEWMNRSHNAKQSKEAVFLASGAGFDQITIDLIYGLPGLSQTEWDEQVAEVLGWPINHLSAYSLTLEERTKYAHLVKKGTYSPPDDERAVAHYRSLQEQIRAKGWEQYEVSNYCKDDNYSKHNTAYWQGERYLGIGPGAHSFDGAKRRWNLSSNAAYIQKSQTKNPFFEEELLTKENAINEHFLTGLRTKWGVKRSILKERFGHAFTMDEEKKLSVYKLKGVLLDDGDQIALNSEGFLFADQISSDLFVDYSSQISS